MVREIQQERLTDQEDFDKLQDKINSKLAQLHLAT
jgi:hypothetical protein